MSNNRPGKRQTFIYVATREIRCLSLKRAILCMHMTQWHKNYFSSNNLFGGWSTYILTLSSGETHHDMRVTMDIEDDANSVMYRTDCTFWRRLSFTKSKISMSFMDRHVDYKKQALYPSGLCDPRWFEIWIAIVIAVLNVEGGEHFSRYTHNTYFVTNIYPQQTKIYPIYVYIQH